jgi:hypothetical protein
LSGRWVASPISVIDSDEVFEARDRVARRRGVEFGEHRLLDLHPLGHGLDHEVDFAEPVVVERAVDAAHDLLELAVGVVLGDLLLRDQAGELPLGHVAGLGQARVHELLLDVLEDDWNAG